MKKQQIVWTLREFAEYAQSQGYYITYNTLWHWYRDGAFDEEPEYKEHTIRFDPDAGESVRDFFDRAEVTRFIKLRDVKRTRLAQRADKPSLNRPKLRARS